MARGILVCFFLITALSSKKKDILFYFILNFNTFKNKNKQTTKTFARMSVIQLPG